MLKKLKNALLPTKENDHHPYIFRREALVVVIIFVLFFEAGFLIQEFIVFKKEGFLAAVLPAFIVSLTNEVRAEGNLGSLKTSPLLSSAAQKKADDMAKRGYFSHVSPEGNPPWYWLDAVGYNYSYAGENLAVNFTDSKELL